MISEKFGSIFQKRKFSCHQGNQNSLFKNFFIEWISIQSKKQSRIYPSAYSYRSKKLNIFYDIWLHYICDILTQENDIFLLYNSCQKTSSMLYVCSYRYLCDIHVCPICYFSVIPSNIPIIFCFYTDIKFIRWCHQFSVTMNLRVYLPILMYC